LHSWEAFLRFKDHSRVGAGAERLRIPETQKVEEELEKKNPNPQKRQSKSRNINQKKK
jgi:hypothetical protein